MSKKSKSTMCVEFESESSKRFCIDLPVAKKKQQKKDRLIFFSFYFLWATKLWAAHLTISINE